MKEFVSRLPKHKASLHLIHNEHKDYYESVEVYYADLDDDDWVSIEQKQKAIETQEVWKIQWYPNSPVGCCILLSCDLEELLKYVERTNP